MYYNNIFEKLLKQNWQYKNTKHKQNIFAQEKHINTIIWQIDNLKKLLVNIKNDSRRVCL